MKRGVHCGEVAVSGGSTVTMFTVIPKINVSCGVLSGIGTWHSMEHFPCISIECHELKSIEFHAILSGIRTWNSDMEFHGTLWNSVWFAGTWNSMGKFLIVEMPSLQF